MGDLIQGDMAAPVTSHSSGSALLVCDVDPSPTGDIPETLQLCLLINKKRSRNNSSPLILSLLYSSVRYHHAIISFNNTFTGIHIDLEDSGHEERCHMFSATNEFTPTGEEQVITITFSRNGVFAAIGGKTQHQVSIPG